MFKVRPYQKGDEVSLAPRLKDIDKNEIDWTSGLSPLQGLQQSIEESVETVTAELDGKPCVMAGIAPSNDDWYGIWLLSDDRLQDCKSDFMEACSSVLEQWMREYAKVYNFVSVRNDVSLRWLQKLGFTLGSIVEDYCSSGEDFIVISKEVSL